MGYANAPAASFVQETKEVAPPCPGVAAPPRIHPAFPDRPTVIQRIRPIVIPFVLGAVISAVLAIPAAAQMTSGIDTANFDHSVRPQDDFFRYVNGGWLKKAEIPADASSWGA